MVSEVSSDGGVDGIRGVGRVGVREVGDWRE